MIIEGNKIIADEGKVLRRKSDQIVVGEEYYLGYIYYIGGERLAEPHLEIPTDFEEVVANEEERKKQELYCELVEKYVRGRYTISDELAIQRQKETKPDDFTEYFNFCEECKARARKDAGLVE